MERPTCKTCPYWEDVHGEESGVCRRLPPQYTGRHASDDSSKSACLEAWDFPWTHFTDFCGEHPDFPAYIASLRPQVAENVISVAADGSQ